MLVLRVNVDMHRQGQHAAGGPLKLKSEKQKSMPQDLPHCARWLLSIFRESLLSVGEEFGQAEMMEH